MKTYQSVLPGATRKDCETQRIGREIKAKLTDVFSNGFWYCADHDGRCERVEGENGQPSSCDVCGSHRIKWNAPIWTAQIDVQDTQLIHPGEL